MSPSPTGLPKRASNIFINYRREDAAGHAGRLFDRLSREFPGRVFMDIDTIEPGTDFVDIINQAVGCCEVLIVMIGREWVKLTDQSGRRRLDNPNDFVRLEIATALQLQRNIRIIPVLVEGAAMPRPEDMPPDLGSLTRRNAIELSDARWAFDVDRLIQTIVAVLQEKAPSALLTAAKPPSDPPPPVPIPEEKRRLRAWLVLAVLVLLPLAGWAGWRLSGTLGKPAPQATRPSASSSGPVASSPGQVETPPGPAASSSDPVETSPAPVETPPTVAAKLPQESAAISEPQSENGSKASPKEPAQDRKVEPAPTPPVVDPEPSAPKNDCKKGFVWREAQPGDQVCVTEEIRQQTAADNRRAAQRRERGSDTCKSGFVFREAVEGDRVCVTPEAREQARLDNSKAGERRKNFFQRQIQKGKDMLRDDQ